MKKQIKRFWGVGLIIIMMSSLFVMPASVSADDNEWVPQSTLSTVTFQLKSGSDIQDIAVYGSGSVVYAVVGDTYVYKSTNGGVTWTKTNTTALGITPVMIAVAPDDSSRIAVTDGSAVYASVNSGSSFSDLGTVASVNGTTTYTMTGMKDLTISPTRIGANYITVCGTDDGGWAGAVFYYNLGAVVGQGWTVKKPVAVAESVDAVLYSPNFVSDLTMVVVTSNTTAKTVALQVYSFANSSWNPTDYPGYPVNVVPGTTGAFTAVNRVSLALDPAYLGGEDTLRNAFIGVNTNAAADNGIYRVLNTTVKNCKSGNIFSVAFDGTTLVAGQADSTTVYRSLDPMSGTPTVTGTSTHKSPGGLSGATSNVTVAFVGANVAAGTCGLNSAFAISRSSGAYFNDISMIDTDMVKGHDMAVSADGAKIYYVTSDNATAYTSVWLKTTGWERILTFAYVAPSIVRLSPTNPDVIYIAEVGGTRIYFSKDVQTRWYARTATDQTTGTFTIKDVAVESDAVAYAVDTAGYVIKSSNEAFTWSLSKVATKLNNGYSLTSVKENVLLTGGTSGKVAYSLDGGTTWSSISPAIESSGATNVIVIPDEDYATNSKIYAATTAAGKNIQEWTIGTSTAWTDKYSGTMGAAEGVYGLAMKGGIIYALTYYTGNSTLQQYIPSVRSWATALAGVYIPSNGIAEPVELGLNTASPNALKASTGSNVLWAIRASATRDYAAMISNFTDTLATTPPTLSGPPDKTSVTINPMTGTSDVVVLTWGRAANATAHTVEVAYDSAFTQKLTVTGSPFGYPPTLNTVIGGSGSAIIPGKTYYWRIRASSPVNSPWSEVRSFTVQSMAAAVPALSSPANGGTIKNQSPAFSWSPVTGTTKYEFQLSTTPTFGTTVLTDTPASAGTLVPVTIKLEKGKQYFWRVRALEPVQGDWSTAANFIIAMDEPAATTTQVTVTNAPPVTITIPPASAPATYTLAPPVQEEIAPTYIWAIIIIGAILVIAVIVLIVRTRRSV